MSKSTSAALVPEIVCENIERSKDFYVRVLGFSIRYERPSERFAYLDREGAELMAIEREFAGWAKPAGQEKLGQGVHFQIMITGLDELIESCRKNEVNFILEKEEAWYRAGEVFYGQSQMAVTDPDGYLLRFAEDLGVAVNPPIGPRIVN